MATQIALLTGASGGLGGEFARQLGRRGYHVVLSGRNLEALERVAGTLRRGCTTIVVADLAEASDRRTLVDRALAEHGRVDLLISNAGLEQLGPIASGTAKDLTQTLSINLEAPLDLARMLVPGMVDAGGGRFLFVSTAGAFCAVPNVVAYSAAKAGLTNLSDGINAEYGRRGVHSTVIYPGPISGKGMWADMLASSGSSAARRFPTITPTRVVRKGLAAVESRKRVAYAALGGMLMPHTPVLTTKFAIRMGAPDVFGAAAEAQAAASLDASAADR